MRVPAAGPFLSDVPAPQTAAADDADEAMGSGLADRLAWFVRLRWLASAALLLIAALGAATASVERWGALAGLAAVIAAYNVACWRACRADPAVTAARLRANALGQMALDLGALIVAIHLTGGLTSPLLPFFGFHMAIGTILLGSERMYFVAGGTSLSALILHLVELGPQALGRSEVTSAVALLAFVGFLFGTVYLTGSVSDRLKQRNAALQRTTRALEARGAELQGLLAELEELERRKSHYMRISAHQLRSPLGTVRTSLDVLSGGYVDLSSERGQRLMRGAAERVDGLLRLVNGLLELAKVREGRVRAPWTRSVNVNQLLADLFDSLGSYAEDRGVRLTADIRAVAILEWGVPPDLVHALENLMHNAIKYSSSGGEVIVHLDTRDGAAVIRVEDHGIGVPDDFRKHLFLEFMRAPNARQHSAEGTGLGLALVREVAAGHGGRVALEPDRGRGTIFRLELPLRGVPPPGAAAVTVA